jgi:hypothetical protein
MNRQVLQRPHPSVVGKSFCQQFQIGLDLTLTQSGKDNFNRYLGTLLRILAEKVYRRVYFNNKVAYKS